ncbi:MAG: NAD-binding protein [Actinomycetota bacterium]|nr:NAD-binding protein [Actinomycetota bacterium]
MIARWLRRTWRRYRGQLAGVAALVALVLGVVGYGQQDPRLSVPDRLYGAIQLFSMSGDANKPPVPLPLEIARWVAPLTVAYAVFRTLSAILLRQWTQARIRLFFRRHVIICGLGKAGLRFATGFHDRGDRVVVIDCNPPPSAIEKCAELGVPVLVGDATEDVALARAGVHRARYLIAVCGDDVINAEVALAVTASSGRRRSPIGCLVQLADERLCQLVDQQALTTTGTGPVDVEFFNAYQAGPAALYDIHPDLLTARDCHPPHLMILGAGRFATALVLEAARRWRLDRANLGWIQITLVAPDADAQAAALHARHPILATSCELTTCRADPSDPDRPAPLPPAGNPANRPSAALICLGDDAATFRATLLARRILPPECPVIACTTGRSSLAELLERSATGMLAKVEGFSLFDRVCRPEVVLNGRRETLAQAIHADYVRRREHDVSPDDPALAPWESLPETLRASNRAQAADLGEKLRAVGCELAPATDWDPPASPFTEVEVEHLAVLEHQRWEAERRHDGWRPGPTRDQLRKISPYLAPWETLPEEIKELDRDAIRALPTFLARAGFAIVRRPAD